MFVVSRAMITSNLSLKIFSHHSDFIFGMSDCITGWIETLFGRKSGYCYMESIVYYEFTT